MNGEYEGQMRPTCSLEYQRDFEGEKILMQLWQKWVLTDEGQWYWRPEEWREVPVGTKSESSD